MTQAVEQSKNPFEGWTTIEDAAELIGRQSVTVRGWVDRGLVKAYPVGRKVRVVNIEEVRAFSKNRTWMINRRRPNSSKAKTG